MSAVPFPAGGRRSAGLRPVPQVESINPEKAKEYLKRMVKNRPLNENRAISLALEMEADKWVLNGETIKFDVADNLIDGQHRLEACVLAKKPFLTWVVRGIEDPLAFATIDVGKTRTHADLFALKGYASHAHASATASVLYYWKRGLLKTVGGPRTERPHVVKKLVAGTKFAKAGGDHSIAKEDLLLFAEDYRDKIAEALKTVDNMKISTRIMPRSLAAALLILFAEKDQIDALSFMKKVGFGEDLRVKDPEKVLRERLLDAQRRPEARLTRWAIMMMAIKAWNARRQKKEMTLIKILENEEYPKIR